ncbi:type VII secretion protein EccB [Lentzea sp. NBRC 105346]|uniref:type VII secretion protein EccB n=1 Tax=Lentzea sp. NBRC 105346 TaxID=3032205 RepID=UPI0024A0F51D|nr:type VII secretion protein EccB [Lentzea sp. NBRC 105346]GLZ32333.1 type VII secretion protein EccB [Lentzea sp. NBRC 105346]
MRVASTSDSYLDHFHRARFSGVAVTIIGLTAGLTLTLSSQSVALPASGIAINEQTGAVYLVSDGALTPTFNVASARLLLARKELETSHSVSRSEPAAEPVLVSDATIRGARLTTGRRTGIPDAPDMLPTKEQRLDSAHAAWGLCEAEGRTTVLAGLDGRKPELGIPLGDDEVLLVHGPDLADQLVYRQGGKVVRARVSRGVRSAWNLTGTASRNVGAALLDLIPEVPELSVPPADDVFRTDDFNGRERYWVVAGGDTHRVTEAVAQLISRSVPSRLTITDGVGDWADTAHYPDLPPRPALDTDKVCVEWTRTGANVYTGAAPSLGVRVDMPGAQDFVMPAGRAAVVRNGRFGAITLVTDHGVAHTVPNLLTAQVLGLAEPDENRIPEAPAALLKLLPTGTQLDISKASCSYDVGREPAASTPPVALPVSQRVIARTPRERRAPSSQC